MKKKIIKKLRNMVKYYRENGPVRFVRHLFAKLLGLEEMSYKRWRRKHRLTKKIQKQQREEKFKVEPVFSILVPLYCTPEKYLQELIESVRNQTYTYWELCFSDGSGKGKMDHTLLDQYRKADPRIKLITSDEALQISENTNCAMDLATGDFLVFADHDDLLAEDALYECVKEINQHPDIDIIYTDEDKITMDGKTYFQPHFKSDFNIDLLRSMNYICHLFVVRREIQEKVGNLRAEYNGAQDYDFVLRCVEQSQKIIHIPQILYHWRAHKDSTSENPESKLYAFEAGKRAVQAHLERCGIKGTVEMGEYLGLYRVKYETDEEAKVSILIPNKDHVRDLHRCIRSLFEISDYQNIEVLIIENNSADSKTFEYYEKIQKKHASVKVITWKGSGEFNYSALNNFGEKYSTGKYLLFLNNDTEILEKNSIREMVSYVSRKDVGAVGARLYYPDGTIQHAGVILGLGGIAGHAFREASHNANGYFSRILCAQDYSAVTAACMMMEKELFEEIGGFDERLGVAFNDIDLCMEIRKRKKLIVYTPFAELYHYESKSRGQENTKEKVNRFNGEVAYFAEKWKKELEAGDPYYNPNLTLEKHDFSLQIV